MRHLVAQTILDVLGDLLSRFPFTAKGVVAYLDSSFIYTRQAHFTIANQVDSKGCPRLLPMSHSGHDLSHDYPDFRHEIE